MKSESHLWNKIKAGTSSKSSVQDSTAFYPNEHVKHKYVSKSEDEDKQKPKEKTKGQGKGKGDGKKYTKGAKSGGRKTSMIQGTSSTSSSQGLQDKFQPGIAKTRFQPGCTKCSNLTIWATGTQ